MQYKIQKAIAVRDTVLLRVTAIDLDSIEDSTHLLVLECPEKKLTFRAARPIFDQAGQVTEEYIFITDKPDFDIETIVGLHLSSSK